MKHFRRTTKGHPVVAGRKTYESFQVRPLPGRLNFILSRNPAYISDEGVIICQDLQQVITTARQRDAQKLFILGGAEIYNLALPLTDEMILTHLPIEVEGDAYFPAWDKSEWEVVEERPEADLVFTTYRRR
jgi:dihydrofolate reductase